MATNRGAYDPRQFLHYPNKDPFSDAAQKRLDDLIKDFLHTGIAFANGASLEDINVDERGRSVGAGVTQHGLNGILEQEGEAEEHLAAVDDEAAEEEEEGEEEAFFRVDKGKARDAREGPGLQGLWGRGDHVNPGTPLAGASAGDAISLLSGSDSGDAALNDEAEDGEGSYDEAYEDGEVQDLDGLEDADQEEDYDSQPDLDPTHSRAPSSEQEIIYIGDSDEEESMSREPEDDEAEAQLVRENVRGNQTDNSPEWASDFDEEEEREGQPNVWAYNTQGQEEEDDRQEDEWHHTQGKESDDDEGGLVPDGGDREEDEDNSLSQMSQVDSSPAARRFFTSAPLVEPWATTVPEAVSSGTTSLAPAAWGPQPHCMHGHEYEQTGEEEANERGDMLPASFETTELSQDQGSAEANELGPPPESEQAHLAETLDPSFPDPSLDTAAISYPHLPHMPIPDPDVHAPVHLTEFTGMLPGVDFANEGQATEVTRGDRVIIPELDEATRAFITSMAPPELSASIGISAPDDLDMFDMTRLEFRSTAPAPHDPSVRQLPTSSAISSGADELADAVGRHFEEGSFMHNATIGNPPLEPVVQDATFTGLSTDLHRHEGNDGVSELMTLLGQDIDVPLEPLPSTNPVEMTSAGLFSEPSEESPSAVAAETSAPTEGSLSTEEEGHDDRPHKPTLLHPAVFDDHEHTTTEPRSLSPLHTATAVPSSPDLESHGLARERLHGLEQMNDQPIVTEVNSEYGDEARQTGDSGEEEFEDVQAQNPSDVTFSEYVVYEVMSEDGRATTPSPEVDTQAPGAAQADGPEHHGPARPIPTVSVGSSTPPLSPATVTNSSSAADPSIATSEFSTANAASVSVVTSIGSPPPIHVFRASPTAADIRRLAAPRVGFASDDEREDEEETAFPDPRLPPEPTHLRIPVEVVGRSLGDDKEDRAESMKVEPPTPHVRSESDDGSMNNDIRGVHDTEKTPPISVVRELARADQDEISSASDRKTSVGSVDHTATDNVDHPAEAERDESISELAYPDSGSDYPSKEDGAGQESVSLSDRLGGNGNTAQFPLSKPALDILNPIAEVGPSTTQTKISPEPSLDDTTAQNAGVRSPEAVANGHMDTNGHTETSIHTQSARDLVRLASVYNTVRLQLDGSIKSPGAADQEPSTPSASENGSPNKSEHNLRSVSKGKGKGKGKAKAVPSPRKRSESPPSHSVITTSRKRSRTSETSSTPSKQPRLTRSAAARTHSTLTMGDAASPSAVSDDKSDTSSIASSSSLVSRILNPRLSGSSSFASVSSRSPSVVSQSSPTNAEHSSFVMPPPIRPYVPHNHSYHAPVAPTSKDTTHKRTTPVPHNSPSVSPSPSTLSQSRSAHQTRASCTDHKISLPGPEGLGLLYFLVPRCSLLDPEVEKDDNIVDCGVATKEEVKRAVGDLEAVGLSSDVLGVIRQLAGVQLMREGQVGYLPTPGERIRPHVKRRKIHVPSAPHSRDVAPQVDPSGPSGAGSSHMDPLNLESAPSPAASSASSYSDVTKTAGVGAHGRKHSKTSIGLYEPTSGDEDESDYDKGAIMPPTPSSPDSVRSPKSSKSRKRGLRPEDAAYKPENDVTDTSSDVETAGTKKKGKGALKRRRSEASAHGDNLSVDSGKTTPKRKRKRKDVEASANHDESLDGASEPRKKKPRRKPAVLRQPREDNLNASV